MKPRAGDARVADETLDSEVDIDPDTDVGAAAVPAPRTAAPAPAPRTAVSAPAPRTAVSAPGVPAQPRAVSPAADAVPRAPERAAPPGAEAAGQAALTDREREVLSFERKWWRHAGSKEQAIRDSFGLSATRYYQILNGLLDNPAALAADPVLVSRLRRLRSTRARTRRR